jgi:osmotically-inducible protein OsmY
LVQSLASARKELKVATATSDLMIREDLLSRLRTESWAKTSRLNVIVHDGTVELWGSVRSQTEKQAVRVAAELTPGVRAVNDNLIVESIASASQLDCVTENGAVIVRPAPRAKRARAETRGGRRAGR